MTARSAGMAHAAGRGVWVMSGRDLPMDFDWTSVPPAPSLSLLWGRGQCRVEHPGGEFVIATDEAMWIDAGHPHRGYGSAGSDFVSLFVPAWVTARSTTAAHIVALEPEQRELILMVAASLLSGRPDEGAIARLHAERGAICKSAPSSTRVLSGSVKRALTLLERQPGSNVDLRALSQAARLTPTHLSRAFAEALGVSPIQYRKQLRLLEATRSLLAGESVTRAAHRAGFADGAHLSRTFRQQYGITPSEWQTNVASLYTALDGRGRPA